MKKALRIYILLIPILLLNPLGPFTVFELSGISYQGCYTDWDAPRAWAADIGRNTDNKNKNNSAPASPEDYTIGKGDRLEVFVWRNDKLTRNVLVRPDGKISLPLIQNLQAAGLTAVQLKNLITSRLKEHINNPRVSVIVTEITSYKVSVLGRVRNPGVYPITGKTTLVEAISLAGGFSEWANKRKITVVTHQGKNKEKLTVNYKKIASGKDPSQNIVLKRGDIIIVP